MTRTIVHGYSFPSIQGVQAGRSFFISMCPLRLIPRIFLFDEEELEPELRAQRALNKGRIPEMAQYVLDNQESYVFSAITASIDADVEFEAIGTSTGGQQIGVLHIPMDARFIINDGQHRRAAIEMALRENPKLGSESIAVVFFHDRGLERCQQMFADLNRYAVRPSTSLGILYDHRDDKAQLTRLVVFTSNLLKETVELERSSLSLRSKKLFTLSAIHTATGCLLKGIQIPSLEEGAELVVAFWEELAGLFPEWAQVRSGKTSPGKVRKKFLHTHAVMLQSFGILGNQLLKESPDDWEDALLPLGELDFRRENADLWEGRALIGGRVSKSGRNVTLTTNALKSQLGLALSADEQDVENAFLKGATK